MTDYITISGTLQDPVIVNDVKPSIRINIQTVDFNTFTPFPVNKYINIQDGVYNFQLLKGGSYLATITSNPQAGSKQRTASVNLAIEIPYVVDDTVSYSLFDFVVTNFTPLLQRENVDFVNFLYNNNAYHLRASNNSLVFRNTNSNRQYNLTHLYRRGGILNNYSFEHELTSEDYIWEPLLLSGTADVDTTQSTDIYYPNTILPIDEGSYSLDLSINNSGSNIDDIILRQKILPNSFKGIQQYRLRFAAKLVSGIPNGDISIDVTNTFNDVINFDNLQFDEGVYNWFIYDSVASSSTTIDVFSSQNYYLNLRMGSIGNINIRIDDFELTEYWE